MKEGSGLIKKPNKIGLIPEELFPGYDFMGVVEIPIENMKTESFLCIMYTLQNIGKEVVAPGLEPIGDGGYSYIPYGQISLIYDDGYTFESVGFQSTLGVLSEPVKEGRTIAVPKQVSENVEAPLMIKLSLPTSAGEQEEFYVSVR